jgi:hypothetical protein
MEQLEQIFPDELVPVRTFNSFLNQPERIQISSRDDISTDTDGYLGGSLTTFYNFRVRLPRPAIEVKTLQLARANVPNPVASFPDSETTFWFYSLPFVSDGNIYATDGVTVLFTFDSTGNIYAGGVLQPNNILYFDSGTFVVGASEFTYDIGAASAGNVNVAVFNNLNVLTYFIKYLNPEVASTLSNYLRYIRLIPSWAQQELLQVDPGLGIGTFGGGINRQFLDYDDLVTELNRACAQDLLEGTPANEGLGEFKFVPNLIEFRVDNRFSKIVFTGLNTNFTYVPASTQDSNWYEAASELRSRDRNTLLNYWLNAFQQGLRQDFISNRNLNLRLGFNYDDYIENPFYGQNTELLAHRPYPGQTNAPAGYSIYDHIAPGFCDLVNTSCVGLYCDIVGGSTVDSITNRALLATIPMNTTANGIGFHSLPLNNPLTKIPTQLNEIYIEMRTDTGEPYYIGNNAIVSLELILTY